MNAFLIDLWNDLREKRLWPVAALLLLGLIAVPIVLSEPSKEPVATVVAVSPPSESGAAKGLAALTVAKDDPGDGSSLDVFDSSNPFKPPQDIIANSDDTTTGPTTGSTGDTSGTASTGAASTPTGTSDSGTGSTSGTAVVKKTTTAYRYVIDATFIANGKKRKIDGMDPLSVLPSHSNALIVFLGVRSEGGNAVFILDKTLYASATGDGKCKPKQDQCGFLFLQAGAKETFTTEAGDTYVLRVRAIRKVKLDSKSLTAKKKASADGDDATGATAESGGAPEHAFVPQFLSDLVSVSGGSDASDQTAP
jgi:hypothetical protein